MNRRTFLRSVVGVATGAVAAAAGLETPAPRVFVPEMGFFENVRYVQHVFEPRPRKTWRLVSIRGSSGNLRSTCQKVEEML